MFLYDFYHFYICYKEAGGCYKNNSKTNFKPKELLLIKQNASIAVNYPVKKFR